MQRLEVSGAVRLIYIGR